MPHIHRIWPWAERCCVPLGHLPCPMVSQPPAPHSIWGSGAQGGACPHCPLHTHPRGVPLTGVQLRPVPRQRCRPPHPHRRDPKGHPAPRPGTRLPVEGTEPLSPDRHLIATSCISIPTTAQLPILMSPTSPGPLQKQDNLGLGVSPHPWEMVLPPTRGGCCHAPHPRVPPATYPEHAVSLGDDELGVTGCLLPGGAQGVAFPSGWLREWRRLSSSRRRSRRTSSRSARMAWLRRTEATVRGARGQPGWGEQPWCPWTPHQPPSPTGQD